MSDISRSGLAGDAPEIGRARVQEQLRLARIRAALLMEKAKQFLADGTAFEHMDTKEKWHAQMEQEIDLQDTWWGWWNDQAWNGNPPIKVIEIPQETFEERWDKLTETERAEAIIDFDLSDPRVAEFEELPDDDIIRLCNAYKVKFSKDGSFERGKVIKVLVDIGLSPSDVPNK